LLYKCIHDMPCYIPCIKINGVCIDGDKYFNFKVSRLLMSVLGIVPETRKISGRK
jgi:hypothetical protein